MLVMEGYGKWIKPLKWVKPVYMQKKDLYKVPKDFYSSKNKYKKTIYIGGFKKQKKPSFHQLTPFFYASPVIRQVSKVSKRKNIKRGSNSNKDSIYVDLNSWSYRYNERSFNRQIAEMRLVRKYSKSPCIFNRTFGFSGNKAWVSGGCRGRFLIIFKKIQKPKGIIDKSFIIKRLLNEAQSKKRVLEIEIKKGQGLTRPIKNRINDLCKIVSKMAEIEGKDKNKIYNQCINRWFSIAKKYEVKYEQKKEEKKHKVSKVKLPSVRKLSLPTGMPSFITAGLTFKKVGEPKVTGTPIIEPEQQLVSENKGIKDILEKKYFGIPFKYMVLGGIGFIALISILGGSSQQKIIVVGGKNV